MLVEAAVLAAQMTVASSAPPLSPAQAVAVLRACCHTRDGVSRNVPPLFPVPSPSIVVGSQPGEGPFGPFPPYGSTRLRSSGWPGMYWGPSIDPAGAFTAPYLIGGPGQWGAGGLSGASTFPVLNRTPVGAGTSAIGPPGTFVP